ncbi:hypothetical protein HBH56_050480 [Parastagonospora nodorum]|uniref:Uncharacterized protein n=1 Tax=Phaeosphaeria nodorum (strain SN15 / ATCC MYA-4574 / FGSC 10173) TaxID=321614 RepID=A0A7U2FFR0_PHANO|nr:hypothetical protein HBH56_050480 [Parastagonospora nodorum]QRD02066.1 hypothetical protein JI435_050390 [Parastagonospora nodorum SN15]KAH3935832.1 hypothetical protein HBH54_036270 [Parastagonospora nodorum]KAH3942646.1 hypothetical protein HBH53_183690 [Parastagonospora nodorum]KAH3964156.1 hypothetical protein HBH51_162140 [Parastagonospora nodorum]
MDSELRASEGRPSRKRKIISYAEIDENTPFGSPSPPRTKKKKSIKTTEAVDLTADSPKKASPKKKEGKRASDAPAEEKRRKTYRSEAPQSYLTVKERAMTQRLTVLSRERCGTDNVPEEKVLMAGSTGNVYTQRIKLVPSCDCPHARFGNQCKHIIYIMLRVLKAREEIAYQLALTTSELRELLKNAPPIPGVETDLTDANGEQDGNRKPIEGECPICYDDLEPGKDAIVYCKASCGNNVHKDCMQKWIAMTRDKATCPYCRATWAAEDGKLGGLDTKGLKKNKEGYINVAGQLGLDGQRDYSTYRRGGRRRSDFEDFDG